MYSGLELMWVLSLDMLPSHMITTSLGNNRIFKMSLSGVPVLSYGTSEILNQINDSLKSVFAAVWAKQYTV